MFFPVELNYHKNTWTLQLRTNVNLTLNKTFLLAYAFFNDLKADQELLDKVFDDFDKDSTVFRTELYELLKDSSLEINFNQDNFIDELRPFKNFKKKDLEDVEELGTLKLYPEAVIGIFPQAGSYLVPDYGKLIESQTDEDLEDFFYKKVQRENENQLALFDRVNEENTFTPFPLDAYQEHALKEIKKGNSLVVQQGLLMWHHPKRLGGNGNQQASNQHSMMLTVSIKRQ